MAATATQREPTMPHAAKPEGPPPEGAPPAAARLRLKALLTGPFWGLGFRPFFLLASVVGAVAIGHWVAVQTGQLAAPRSLPPAIWHGHEMIQGFAVAVIAGFVLTASQNWTGIRGVNGPRLQALAGLWLLGRVLLWTLPGPSLLAALADLAFLPLLAWALAPYLVPPAQRRNRVFLGFFALLFLGNLLLHLDALGVWPGMARAGLRLSVYAVLLVIVLIGGRVIPFFSRNLIPGGGIVVRPRVEALAHLTALALLPTAFLPEDSPLAVAVGLAAAVAHGARWAGWFTRPVLRTPILWVLYAGYLWIVVGFLLTGLRPWLGMQSMGYSLATLHAFTVGGIGVTTFGMMTRIALGHTGRPIRAARAIVSGYALVNLAALARVVPPLLDPAWHTPSVVAAGALWVAAFLLLALRFAPILLQPREAA
jgi:uncharacterized protein involved in response to NO